MDAYGLFDLIAVILGLVVAMHVKTTESILLALFFICSSLSSFILFQTDYFIYFQHLFVMLSVIFGLSSNRHPVTLGYAGYLILIGLNAIYEISLYSLYIYLIYAYQLWVVRYEARGSRIGRIWVNHFGASYHKNNKTKEVT